MRRWTEQQWREAYGSALHWDVLEEQADEVTLIDSVRLIRVRSQTPKSTPLLSYFCCYCLLLCFFVIVLGLPPVPTPLHPRRSTCRSEKTLRCGCAFSM